MDIDAYASLLLNRIQPLTAWDARMIVNYVFSSNGPQAVIGYAVAPDWALYNLINEASYYLQLQQQNLWRLYHPGSSSHVIPAPIGQRQLHQGLTQVYTSGSSLGVQAFLPTGPTGGFERPKEQPGPCPFFFLGGHCIKGGKCRFSHESEELPAPPEEVPVHTLETLPTLENEIRELLNLHQSPVPVDLLPKLYFEKYAVSLLVEGIPPEGRRKGEVWYSIIRLLMRFNTIKVTESNGQNYGVPVEDDSELGDVKPVLAPATSGCNKISITFDKNRRFSYLDVREYFRKYGPVNYAQCLPERTYGFVSFVYTEAVKLIFSEESKKHYINGESIDVRPYRDRYAVKPAPNSHPNSGAHKVSAINFNHKDHSGRELSNSITIALDMASVPTKGENTAESSNLPNRLDEASDQDGGDIIDKLPRSLDEFDPEY
ncbi:hypothetical protein ACP4OV_018776 [Aristida adscensionis]